jgi:hypothetical protein
MKKLTLLSIFIFAFVLSYSQIDSSGIQTILSTGVNFATATNNTIIPNVPNEITGSLITIIAGFIIRFLEKRSLRRKGKLTNG